MTPGEPARGPACLRAAPAGVPALPGRPRLALLALLAVTVSFAVVLIACELAAARAPQYRAALEELIRHETGLEVSFSELSLRWGWHGPEALFHAVVLGEPGGGAWLRAPRLIVALDLARMVRSGRLEAGRITLEGPDMDFTTGAASAPRAPLQAPRSTLSAGARILSRWRGGVIEIEAGTLRGLLPDAAGGTLSVSHALLRRLGPDWNADARVRLPESLGVSARLALQMSGDPAVPQSVSGTLRLEGQRLELGGWRALALSAEAARLLPRSGSGNLELHMRFAGGRLLTAGGWIDAGELEWTAPSAAVPPLALERLQGEWQLTQRRGEWHLDVNHLKTRAQGRSSQAATLSVDVAADDSYARGHARHAPLGAAALLAAGCFPQIPLRQLVLGGEARELSFDWSARRHPGARLLTRAMLSGVTVGTRDGGLLEGLHGRVSGTEGRLVAELEAQAAQLAPAGEPGPPLLDGVKVAARLSLETSGGGWHLRGDDLQLRHAHTSLAASGSIGAAAADAAPRARAHLAIEDADFALIARLLGPRVLATLGPAATHLTGGHIESADLTWRGALTRGASWDVTPEAFTGAVVVRDAGLGRYEPWPDADGIDARIRWRGPRVHVLIERARGGSLLPGLPPIEALRGSLAFADGHLQRSTFGGRWLGGPVSLVLGEHREGSRGVLTISGRGLMAAREAMQAAGGDADEARLGGNAEWSAQLTFFPGVAAPAARWRLRADSALIGVTSRLPEPFAKSAGTALPLHLEVQAAAEAGQLRVSLGDRLRALASLVRSDERWRIERAAVRLAGNAPALPEEPVMLLDGRLSRLDLATCLGLWRAVARDAALPELRARLSAGQLLAGERSYADVDLAARVAHGGGAIQLRSAELLASARWPAVIERGHPAVVHLASFSVVQPGDTALAAALAAALAPAAELSIDDLQWQGRSLGRLTATLAWHADSLEVSELQLAGAAGLARASTQCAAALCRARFSLASPDAAASLAAFGLRPEVSADEAILTGELRWSPQMPAPLATLAGHLHMQLSAGLVRAGAGEAMPFALLSVPALLAGSARAIPGQPPHTLGFTRLTGDFELRDGEATTSGLHFDGDAEILVRGRVGLVAGDYDEQAWILRGEERLPAPLRRLGPTPPVAALWLSLRDWFAGAAGDPARTSLRLRGTWNDPVVTPDE